MKFTVPDMSCGHCTAAIEKAVKTADPAAAIECDLPSRKVRVETKLSAEQVAAVIREAGYDSELSAA